VRCDSTVTKATKYRAGNSFAYNISGRALGCALEKQQQQQKEKQQQQQKEKQPGIVGLFIQWKIAILIDCLNRIVVTLVADKLNCGYERLTSNWY